MLSGVERNGVLEIVGGRNVVVWRCDSKTREEQPPAVIASRVIICWPPGLFLHSTFCPLLPTIYLTAATGTVPR